MAEASGDRLTVDPVGVTTPDEFSACLDTLRRRRGLSYNALVSAVLRLPARRDGKRWEPLSKTTIGEIVTGVRMPSRERLLSYLAACSVSPADVPQWLAAWERASAAGQDWPPGAVRVRDVSPRTLGVHAAIQSSSVISELPIYVPRSFDSSLREAISGPASSFVLLVGGSSVGKSRSLYEAVHASMPDWWLIHPSTPEDVRALASTPLRRVVLWLDELQAYLGGKEPLTAATLRSLLMPHRQVAIVGTLWPDRYIAYTSSLSTENWDSNRAAKELIGLARAMDVPAHLDPDERRDADRLSKKDPRIKRALESSHFGMTQILAAGPELVRRWENAGSVYESAVLTAAIDFGRLDTQSPMKSVMLEHAAVAYLSNADVALARPGWFQHALSMASTPVMGAASPLEPTGVAPGVVDGFTLADFLLEHGREVRQGLPIPDPAWRAFIDYTSNPEALNQIASAARRRALFGHAADAYRRAIILGDASGVPDLARMLDSQGRHEEARAAEVDGSRIDSYRAIEVSKHQEADGKLDEAEETLFEAAKSDHPAVLGALAALFRRRGFPDEAEQVEELAVERGHFLMRWGQGQRLEEQGETKAAEQAYRKGLQEGNPLLVTPLGRLLVREGRPQEAEEIYRQGLLEGNPEALRDLINLLEQQGRVDEAERVCRTARCGSYMNLVWFLTRHDRLDEAIEVLRDCVSEGQDHALLNLASLLKKAGREEEATSTYLEGIAAGDLLAEFDYACWLAARGQLDEAEATFRSNFAHGNVTAAGFIADTLVRQGRIEEAEAAYRSAILAGDELAGHRFMQFLQAVGRNKEAQAFKSSGLAANGTTAW